MSKAFNVTILCASFAALISLAAMGCASGRAEAKVQAPPPARPAAFAVCSACHATEAGKTIVGPSLAGVSGRRAGSLAGYAYSEALKNSGLTWDRDSLDTWLTSPQKMVPGTKMPFMGIADPVRRKAVVDYLLTL
ncbi:c-type cytochrome [Novosphingobium beihaiensis]|uniref:C-type cytochrome n=1 Tax=Novosphingobium beihaiensis TaxID=2930389 RepID=A0ABT0BL55_9SPHN|nr:c-type cytochrome [Novosphingobium beihaiensis]MCJ2185551.1 c-type cytochrome [Novosphingobium beihaiensis]